MKKELDNKEQCQICFGNHYIIDEDEHIHQCPDCTISEQNIEEQNNEQRT